MKVILDSTVFRSDYEMGGNGFLLFMSGLPRVGASLAIPIVVIEEVVNGYREDLEEAANKMSSIFRSLKQRQGVSVASPLPTEKVAELVSDYSKRLNVSAANGIIPLPQTSHDAFLKRALARKKPFNEQGAGYRDALIWDSILELLKAGETICFISANVRDFGASPQVHQDLLADLDAHGIPHDQFVILKTLEDFNSQFIVPKLQRLDEFLASLSDDKHEKFSVKKWIEASLRQRLIDDGADEFLASLDPTLVSVSLFEIKGIRHVEIDDVRLMPNGNILVSVTAKISCDVSITASWKEYLENDAVRNFFGEDDGEPFSTVSSSEDTDGEVRFALILDGKTFEVISSEIDEVSGPTEWIRYQPHLFREPLQIKAKPRN